jgi:LysM repeat protein
MGRRTVAAVPAARPVRRAAPASFVASSPGAGRSARGRRGSGGGAPLRLTARGRVLAQSLLLLAVVSIVVGVSASTRASSAVPPPSGPHPAMVVQQGDTLWGIANRYAPHRDHAWAMREIRRLNRLRDSDIEVGQKLVLPVP